MKNMLILLSLLITVSCNNKPAKSESTSDDIEDFMKNVFGENNTKPRDCDELIANADFSNLCISKENNFNVKKDIENQLICIHVMRSKNSTVDIAINNSPIAMLTSQIFKAAKSDADKKGKVKKLKNIGVAAFYSEYKYSSGDWTTINRDLVFYVDKSMYTLHTVTGSNRKDNCMAKESELKKIAKALLQSANQ